jgi:hypothetical protein
MNLAKKFLYITVTALFTLTSCNKESEQSSILYYPDSEAMYYVPITKKLKLKNYTSEIAIASQIIDELKNSPSKDLRDCIPESVSFSDISYNKDKKNFSIKFNSSKQLGDEDEQLMIGCMINSLSELKDVDSLSLNTDMKTNMDYSEPITKESYKNSFLDVESKSDNHNLSSEVVYWYNKGKKYLVPVSVSIPSKDVLSLLKELKKGPTGINLEYFEPSIPEGFDINIKSVNAQHISLEIKTPSNADKDFYNSVEKIVTLTIFDLKVFDTINFTLTDGTEKTVDLKKVNPKEDLNFISSSSD